MTPRSRCENDAGYETRLLEAPDPKRGPHFYLCHFSMTYVFARLVLSAGLGKLGKH